MNFMVKWGVAVIPALALASGALAAPRPIGLSDSQEPGSLLIFPKFINMPQVSVDGTLVSRTEIELGAVCPPEVVNTGGFCPEHQVVKVRLHWVCRGAEGVDSNICREHDFDIFLTVNGKVAFSADGNPINANTPPLVPPPDCPRGYLIAWAVNQNDQPIKWDGLVGDAVIRGPALPAGAIGGPAGQSTAVSAYQAITVQADPALPVVAASQNPGTIVLTAGPGLVFNGQGGGGYTTLTGVAIGDVKFEKTAAGLPLPNVFSQTFLTFLTLDVRSNQPNNPVFMNVDFWNESQVMSGNANAFEHLTSTMETFVCWDQVSITSLSSALTQAIQGTRKGVFIAGPAMKVADGNAPGDHTGEVTLIALVETVEGNLNDMVLGVFTNRKYNFNTYNDSFPVTTTFLPLTRPGPRAP